MNSATLFLICFPIFTILKLSINIYRNKWLILENLEEMEKYGRKQNYL